MDSALLESQSFKDYKNAFNASSEYKKLKDSKDYKDSQDKQELEGKAFLDFALKIEKDKLLYFSLSLNKEVLVIKAPSDNKEQKRFLGYEWSNRKGDEGLKELNKPYLSPLFERDNPTNPNKLNFLVREAFNHTLESIPKELEPYAFRARLVDMLDFEKVEFNKAISLNPVQGNPSLRGGAEAIHANPFANSKYKLVRLGDIKGIAIKKGKSITKKETKEGVIKVVAGGINYAYLHNEANRPENTITISASGANAGFVNFWQEEIFASDCTTINLDSDISIRFVFYILQSIQKNIYGGTGRKNIF